MSYPSHSKAARRKATNDRRARARELGLCAQCGSTKPERKPQEGRRTCEPCLESARASDARARTNAAWCCSCQAFDFHRKDCENYVYGLDFTRRPRLGEPSE